MIGVGLRPHHYPEWKAQTQLPLLEVLSDNYLFQKGGPGLYHLAELSERTSLILHGVGLNIGGHTPLHQPYLQALRDLIVRTRPLLVSDHLCFTSTAAGQTFDLLPVQTNEAELQHIARRVLAVQDYLGRPLLLEYISTYVATPGSEFSQSQFLNELAKRTGCGVLLDVNNVFVCAFNHGFDAWEEIARIDPRHVWQYHIAGHGSKEGSLYDTHAELIREEVWALLRKAWQCIGPRPCIIERDDEAPFAVLQGEWAKARGVIG